MIVHEGNCVADMSLYPTMTPISNYFDRQCLMFSRDLSVCRVRHLLQMLTQRTLNRWHIFMYRLVIGSWLTPADNYGYKHQWALVAPFSFPSKISKKTKLPLVGQSTTHHIDLLDRIVLVILNSRMPNSSTVLEIHVSIRASIYAVKSSVVVKLSLSVEPSLNFAKGLRHQTLQLSPIPNPRSMQRTVYIQQAA